MAENKNKIIHAVFEGGGVKGTGLVGAVSVAEGLGYRFGRLAGTSAGAIVASLLAAGYTAAELKEILFSVDYKKFKDINRIGRVPWAGEIFNLFFKKGVYEGDYFENWLRGLLAKKGVRGFSDLTYGGAANANNAFRLQVIASDITRGRLLVLPQDSAEYGIGPGDLDVARAVRMSMSIPYFYKPVVLRDKQGTKCYVVDGGILSNFPVWLYDQEPESQDIPTIGFKLVEPEEGKPRKIYGPVTFFAALFSTMTEAHDARYIKDQNFMRTVPIPTLGVQSTDFSLPDERKQALFESGKTAGQDFFAKWDFKKFKQQFKHMSSTNRSSRLKDEK
jgi:NTE family protein